MGARTKMTKAVHDKMLHGLVDEGKTLTDMALEVGVCQSTMSRWFNTDAFQDDLRYEMGRAFGEIAPRALQTLANLLGCGNPSVEFAAAKELLNKAGYKETDKVEATTNTTIEVEVSDD